MSIRIIGITGPSGSGKSLLSQHLLRKGFPTIDADEVYHSLLVPPSECLSALRSVFGDEIFMEDGALNRKALSGIVFSDSAKLTLLNQTVLGFVLAKIRTQISAYEALGHASVIVDAPTLIESGFHNECDTVISVLADPSIRISRIMARDGLSRDTARLRVAAQKSDDFYREHSNLIFFNNGDEASFLREVDQRLAPLSL